MLTGAAPELGNRMSVPLSVDVQARRHAENTISINYVGKRFDNAFLSESMDRAEKYMLGINGPI